MFTFKYFCVASATLFSSVLGIQKVTGQGHRDMHRDTQTRDAALEQHGGSQVQEQSGIWDFISSLFEPEGTGMLYNLRVCNAYTSRKAMDMHRVRGNVSKIFGTGGLRYKMCHDFPMAAQTNDTFIFEVGGLAIANYTLPEITGEAPSVVMLVPHRQSRSHHDKSASVKFRVFGNETHRELSLVNSVPRHLKRQQGGVMLLETKIEKAAKKTKAKVPRAKAEAPQSNAPPGKAVLLQSNAVQKRTRVRTHLVRRGFTQLRAKRLRQRRYEVMASSRSNGTISAVVDASKDKEGVFTSAFDQKYVVMRVGNGEPAYPEELVVFPSESSAFRMHLHIAFAFTGLLVHFGLQ